MLFKKYSKAKFSFKVCLKEAPTFFINLFLFNGKSNSLKFNVFTDDIEKREIKLNFERPIQSFYETHPMRGEAKLKIYQRFNLQPSKYIF